MKQLKNYKINHTDYKKNKKTIMENVSLGQNVLTPYGKAIVKIVDNDSKSVKVEHTEAKTPITDFYFKDLKKVN